MRSSRGVATVILFILVAVIILGVITIILTNPNVLKRLHGTPMTVLDVSVKKEGSKYILVFTSVSGDVLNLKDVEVVVTYRGFNAVYKYPFLYDEDGILKVGEKFGVLLNLSLRRGDVIDVKVIHIPTRSVLLDRSLFVSVQVTVTPTLPIPPNSSYLVLNVDKGKWYRTIGDAVRDADDGNTLLVYPGYDVKENLIVDKSLTIKAVEFGKANIRGNVRLKSGNTSLTGFNVFGSVNVYGDDCELSDDVIKSSSYGVIVNKAKDVRIRNCKIKSDYYGIYVRYGENLEIVSSEVDSRNCIWLYVGSNAVFKNVELSGYRGFYIYGFSNILLESNRLKTSYGVQGFNSNLLRSFGSVFDCSRYSFYLYNVSNVSIESNNISESSRFTYCKGELKLINNVMSGSSDGVYVYKCDVLSLRGNSFKGYRYALSVYKCEKARISDNTVSNVRYGLRIASTKSSIIDSNRISDADYGIVLSSSNNVTVEGNYVKGNTGMSMYDVKNASIEGNRFDVSSYGLIVRYSEGVMVKDNILKGSRYDGMRIDHSEKVTLKRNDIAGFYRGIKGFYGKKVLMEFNSVNCSYSCVYLVRYSDTVLKANKFRSENKNVALYTCTNLSLSENDITGGVYGSYMSRCDGVKMIGNRVFKVKYGIYAYRCRKLEINSNDFTSCDTCIRFSRSKSCIVSSNEITNSSIAVNLYSSNKNTITSNLIEFNGVGIMMQRSENNSIYNNLFNNTNNVKVDKWENFWNTTKEEGRNIVGGRYLGGNAWLSPDGNGFSQTCSDADKDGICDSAYVINGKNVDYLPLKFGR